MNPNKFYLNKLNENKEFVNQLAKKEDILANLRFTAFLATILLFIIFLTQGLSLIFILPFVLSFTALVMLYNKTSSIKRFAERRVLYYEHGLKRLNNTWIGTGKDGSMFIDSEHPYSQDLDIFGKGSLFELICTARTFAGEKTLAKWFCEPENKVTMIKRQESIKELMPRTDLREEIALLGEDAKSGVDSERLVEWIVSPSFLPSKTWRSAAILLPIITVLSIIAWLTSLIGIIPMLVAITIQSAFAIYIGRKVERTLSKSAQPTKDIVLLWQILFRLEREQFQSLLLSELQKSFQGSSPSKTIKQLYRLMALLDSKNNMLFALFAPVLLWSTNFAFAIEAWKRKNRENVIKWIDTIGNIEAVSSLSCYAFEHPNDTFPNIKESSPVFSTESIGHPLIHDDQCVRNDLKLGETVKVYIVSGSNMSGKSTLLRSIGINIVLAYTGAPVRAKKMEISEFRIGASIGRSDSLQQGISRFYMEIKRLKQILDISKESSHSIFLVDEILNGTNSHDRQIGVEAIIRNLVKQGSIGLVTTHDLSLTGIANSLKPQVDNIHFEDHLEKGQMIFDYKIRPGIVTKSNAIELMKSVGLDI